MPEKPTCPKCGGTDVEFIGSHQQYPAGANRQTDSPTSENLAYKCKCGLAFTVMVKLPDEGVT